MRRNFFLHFLNRDSREIFGLYRFQDDAAHYRLLRRALNACVLLCEDHCIMPPGFVIEDEISFNLAESQRDFLESCVLQFPIRESSLSEYAEKKRAEYFPMRNRYSGLFDDTRLDFIGRSAKGLIHRNARISEGIISGWEAGPDAERRVWSSIVRGIDAPLIEKIQQIPRQLYQDGTALTWSAIAPKLPDNVDDVQSSLRNALQYTYFKQYCVEFGLIVLSAIPYMIEEFYLPRQVDVYNYRKFAEYLGCFNLTNLLLESRAPLILQLRRMPAFVSFVDTYVQMAAKWESTTNLVFHATRAGEESGFDWRGFGKRHATLIHEPTDLELLELRDGLIRLADILTERFGLEKRSVVDKSASNKESRIEVVSIADIVVFVALDEELQVLAKELGLRRHAKSPFASGLVKDTFIEVISPKEMGRVPAAVETARYLEARRKSLPSLIIVVGLAGGFPEKDTKRGHIVCASTAVDLANRKIIGGEESSTKFRRKDFPLSPVVYNVLSSDDFNFNEWSASIIGDWPKDRRPSLHPGPLASVDEVVSSSEWRKQLLSVNDKMLGVEMEAGGVCAAAQSFGVKVAMLRAVSDDADPSKADDQWRSIGMKALSSLLAKLPYDVIKTALMS